jgi:hypothetical protein
MNDSVPKYQQVITGDPQEITQILGKWKDGKE